MKKKSYIKSVKRVDREREIELFGKLISTRPTRIAKNKKKYNRKNIKQLLWKNVREPQE